MTGIVGQSLILIGGGGHAKVLADCIHAQGGTITGYVDPKASGWLDAQGVSHLAEDQIGNTPNLIMGYVGRDTAALESRYRKMMNYIDRGARFPVIAHPSVIISPRAKIAEGVHIFPGAVVNAYAEVQMGAILNSNAIVEHDAIISKGVHIAPAAVVLGGARVAEFCYVGAHSVIVQNSEVLPCTFIKAGVVHK